MLTLRRYFATSRRALNAGDSTVAKVLTNVLEHQCLDPLRHQLPSKSKIQSPYDLSESVSKIVTTIPDEEASAIHNKLIEELSRYEYGISQIHAKKLQELGRPLSSKSVLEIVKNNPGRVFSSWELLLKYGSSMSLVPDDLLIAALNNTLKSIDVKDEEQRVHNLSSVAQCITLMNNIHNTEHLSYEVVEKLALILIEMDASCALPSILQQTEFPFEAFQQHKDVLSDYQTYVATQFCPFERLKKDEDFLLHAVDVLGQNKVIAPTEQEHRVAEELLTHFERISNETPSSWTVGTLSLKPFESAEGFLKLFEHIQEESLDQRNLNLAKKLLRIFGIFRDNTQVSLELYHSYLLSYSKNATDLMFETFLSLAYQGFRTSNRTLLKYAEVFVPQDLGQSMLTNVFRTLILVNSRFDIDESLRIYNDNIASLSKVNNEATNLSPSALVTEALILAYLSRNDLDFARVIFDGCAKEKTISGPTAIKRIKSYLALFGEAHESGKEESTMADEIMKVLKHL